MKKAFILSLTVFFAALSTAFAGYASHKEAMKAGDHKLFRDKDFAAAQAIFEEAAEMAEKPWQAGSAEQRIGVCLIKQGQVDEGIAQLTDVLEGGHADYVTVDALVALGDVYHFRLKDDEKAAEYYKKALGYDVNDNRKAGIKKKLAKTKG
jgi:tetratricopeptide (TPR) repeat protein